MPNDIGNAIEVALHIARESGKPAVIGEIPVAVGLVCFDMDGTIIKMETINSVAGDAGIGREMENLTFRAMGGAEDFKENFRRRVRMLKDVPVNLVQGVASRLVWADGLETLMQTLRSRKIKTAIITGNFNVFGEVVKERFGFDYVFTSVPEIKGDLLTGEIAGDVIDANAKVAIMKKLCAQLDVPLENTIAVGDGANDVPMLAAAGVAVVYNAIKAETGIDDVILPLLDV